MKILLLLALLVSAPVYAVDIELSAGRTTYRKSDNGVFWQNGFENEFQLKSNSIGLGITDYLTESTRYRIGYMDLGWVSSYAKAVPTDANYNGVDGCNGPCLPLAQWHGSGKVEGLYFTLAPEMVLSKNIKIFFEGGFWLYQATHSMIIPDTISCDGCAPVSYHFIHKRGIDHGFVYGVGIEYKNTQFVTNFWQSNVNGIDPNTDLGFFQGYTMNIALRHRF